MRRRFFGLIRKLRLVRVLPVSFIFLFVLSSNHPAYAAVELNELGIIADSTGSTSDGFGGSIKISGDTIVVGASGDDNEGTNAGSAFIFQRDHGGAFQWGQVARLTASDAEAYNGFGSVDIDGDTVVVGAYLAPFQTDGTGIIYVYERDQGGTDNWGQTARISPPAGNEGDQFGLSVAIHGDLILVGSDGVDDVEPGNDRCDSGKAFVFSRDQDGPGAWGLVATLSGSAVACGHGFGYTVALDSGLAVIGTLGTGAYLFEAGVGGTWSEIKHFPVPVDSAPADHYGYSVGVWGSTVMIGAPNEDETCEPGAPLACYGNYNIGAVYAYLRDFGGEIDSWGLVAKMISSDKVLVGNLGTSIDMTGDLAIVGAPGASAAYVFSRATGSTDSWGEVRKLVSSSSSAYFGGFQKVGISGDLLTVGDPFAQANGLAFIYARPDDITPPSVININSSADTGDGEVGEGEITAAQIDRFYLTMNEDLWDPSGLTQAHDVTNPANYLLINDGGDGFDTTSCESGVHANDAAVGVDSVGYDPGTDIITVNVNGSDPLPSGSYRLLVCGTTTVKDLAGNGLDGNGDGASGDDFSRTFHIDRDPPDKSLTFTVTSHTPSMWSGNGQISMDWSGATDVGLAGLAGYSNGTSLHAGTQMDSVVDTAHGTDPHSWTSDPLDTGQNHYAHIRTCDTVGNCADTSWRGPFWIDVTKPALPVSLTSSHGSGWSTDNTIEMTWSGASDGESGLGGYSFAFEPTTVEPDHIKDMDHGTDPHSVTSAALADGYWRFRIATVDNVGNWSTLSSMRTYKIDTSAPVGPANVTSSTHVIAETTDVRQINMTWTEATDAGSGFLGYWHAFTENPTETCGMSQNTWGPPPVTGVSSTLANGTWYFHICAGDKIGHWTQTISIGPYIIAGGADIELTQTESVDPVQVDSPLTYIMTVRNNGPLPSENVGLYGQLDWGVDLVSMTPPSPTCEPVWGEVYWTISCDFGTMAADDTQTVVIEATAPSSTGTIESYAYLSTTTEDGQGGNNNSSEFTVVQDCDEPTALPGANQTIEVDSDTLLGENPPASGGTPPYTAAWDLTPATGASLDNATAQNPTFSSSSEDSYTATLVITDSNSCVSQPASTVITVTMPPDLILSDTEIAEDKTIERCRSITAEQVRIVAPYRVVFRAGEKVDLGDGFVVDDGAEFIVVIDPTLTCP